ncbi:hypothetical protein Sjap_016344 [Stephania japonica]|uniref:RRM domain-containing protein n=1 Tax=Stephania japonica TaxID=461633 RepID=A0AAP0NRS3_9MAGN
MDPMSEEQLDYGEEEYGSQKLQYQGSGAIPALAEEELMGEDDEYDDLYNDVNVGEGFLQAHRSEAIGGVGNVGSVGNGALQGQRNEGLGSRAPEHVGTQEVAIPGVGGVGGNDSKTGPSSFGQQGNDGGYMTGKGLDGRSGENLSYSTGVSQGGRLPETGSDSQVRNEGFRGPVTLPPKVGVDTSQVSGKFTGEQSSLADQGSVGVRGAPPMVNNQMGVNVNRPMVNENVSRPLESGATMLFVGELHWWTTDAELESALSQYGRVKEIKFYDERASGKSKGYCHVEFFDPSAATACKDGMNGHVFNGRACVVAFATPQTVRQMGAAYTNKSQVQVQSQSQVQGRRPMNDGAGRGGGMNYVGGDAGGRNFNKVGWGRGGQGMNGRGQGGPMRGRGGGLGPKNMAGGAGGMGTAASVGNPYGQGLAGPAMGGPTGGMMHPQNMMGAGFDPTYMGRGGYGGFPGPVFPGMMPSFPGVNPVALTGVAPHVNPAFFGRGMSANGMGMMAGTGMDGHHAGMWGDTSMGGWAAEDGRTRESSYGGDDGASDYGYGEASHERGGRSTAAPREKDRSSERDWSGNSERRHRDEREQEWERPEKDRRYRDEKDSYREHRQRERDRDNGDEWERGHSSSRPRSRSSMMQEDDHRSRSRDLDYGKRRRLPSE